MLKGIFNTLGGKAVAMRRLDMISNNIANSLTPGYKTSTPVMNIAKTEGGPDGEPVTVNLLESYIHFSDAPLVETSAPLDVAIEGEGFFVVSTREGEMYTRNGQFTLNKDKKLVTMDGSAVLGQSGEITLDGKDIMIENDGSIFVDRGLAATLRIVDFKDRKALRPYGRSQFVQLNEKEPVITPEKYTVKQGAYEASNVDVIKELVEMMSSLRAYESYSKVDQFFSDMMSKLSEVGRI